MKSGASSRATLATLNSDRQWEKAEFGFLITMDLPTKAMRDEIAAAGRYKHPMLNREDDRLQVITVAEILSGDRLNLPMAHADAVKSATAHGRRPPDRADRGRINIKQILPRRGRICDRGAVLQTGEPLTPSRSPGPQDLYGDKTLLDVTPV